MLDQESQGGFCKDQDSNPVFFYQRDKISKIKRKTFALAKKIPATMFCPKVVFGLNFL